MRKTLYSIVIVSLLCVSVSDALANANRTGFEAANGHYAGRRWSDAAREYEQLLSHDVHNAVVYYNLANTYFQQKRYGWAVLSYKRAYDTANSEELKTQIRHNLELTREAIIRKKSEESTSVAVLDETHGVFYSLFHLMGSNGAAGIFGIFWLLMFALLIARRIRPSLSTYSGFRALTVACIVLTVLSGSLFAGNIITSNSTVRGIVVDRNVKLKQGSIERDVTEGLEVEILDASDPNESLIRLSNGWKGRVPARSVQQI